MSHTRNMFASLSVFTILLGASSIASAQVIPPQPIGAPSGGVEFFLPTYVTASGKCACWDSDGAVNGGYNPETASAIFGVCYENMVAPDGTPYTLYMTGRTVPNAGSCYAEFVCGQPNYTDSNGVTQPARAMYSSGPDLDPNTEVIYSEIDTECTNCNLSPLKGWIGYQGSGMNGVAPELMNISFSSALVETQLGGFYDWSSGNWSGGGNYLNNGSGYQLPYCVGTYTPQSYPAFPPLNMVGGGGNVISEYPTQYELSPVGGGNTGGNTGGNVLNTANLTKAVNAANGGKQMEGTVEKKTTVVKGKYYTTYRTEIIVKPAPVKQEVAPVKAAPVTKK
jgi:hypothetical protein